MRTAEVTDIRYVRHSKGGERVLYQLSDADTASSTSYYGYVSGEGSWLVMEEINTTGVVTYRYSVGWADWATTWANRAGLNYVLFSNLGDQI